MRMAVVRMMFLLLALGAFAQAAPKPAGTHKKHNADLADSVDGNIIFSKFAALVRAADLGTFMSSRGPFTLFVPTNSAFSKLPPGMFEDLLQPVNKTQAQRMVLFHLVYGKLWFASDLKLQKSVVSCEGHPLPLKTSKAGTLFVDKAKVLRADVHCTNGLLDEVDTILMPPQLVLVAATESAPGTNAAPANAAPAPTNAAPLPVTPDTSEPDPNVPAVPAMQ
jgi:uncharacterized surface protein with fasciclin (FAS1) repeats